MQILQKSWQRAWAALGVEPEAGLFERLVACYDEPQRRYHTGQHLRECIERIEPVLGLTQHPGEVEAALWFHDAVYDPKGQDNEMQSAQWGKEAVLAAGLSEESAARIYALVMATRHSALPASIDESVLVDADLSILGAERERFDEYERQVREEYGWVPGWMFRRKRRAILQEFLDRAVIYSTEYFRAEFEVRSRQNLRLSITALGRKPLMDGKKTGIN